MLRSKLWLTLTLLLGVGMTACEQKQPVVLEPLPVLAMPEVELTPFLPKTAWSDQLIDWKIVSSALRDGVTMPDALETRLTRDDREIWKRVSANVEAYEANRRDALVLASAQVPQAVECVPPSSAFSLQQRAMLSRMLQQHRNVLWRLGRLEMASRYVKTSLNQFLPQYAGGRIKDADTGVVQPIRSLFEQIQEIRSRYQTPNGVWSPGELHFRMARLAQIAPAMLQLNDSFGVWADQIAASARWRYLVGSAEPVREALKIWLDEYESVLTAYRHLASATQALEQSFGPPNQLVAFPCINQNLRRMRILANLFQVILPMQWSLAQSEVNAMHVHQRVLTPDYREAKQEFMASEVVATHEKMVALSRKLAHAADLLLIMWDQSNYSVWSGLPDFVDPIHHHSGTAVEDAETWRAMYSVLQGDLARLSTNLKPEPEQPLNKYGKPYAAPVQKIVEEIESPTRIDEVEHGLLSISEIESHLVAIRDQLLRLCMDGACRSFPEAELANSPRKSQWVVSWRQSPVSERTIGHSLIVLKLCQLHLSRLVQRLAEIYGWFAETSNADITWKTLKAWQRIWTLYAEPNGTYANFLRSVSTLDKQIMEMAIPLEKRAQSPELLELLKIQDELFDLTIDYARFIDARVHAPVPFDDITETWLSLQSAISTIARLTAERDEKAAPEAVKTKKRVRQDVDR